MRNKISKVNKLKEAIIYLDKKGLSYRKIQNQLACSKSTISYHLGKGQKEKAYDRVLKQRENDIGKWLNSSSGDTFKSYDKTPLI